MRTKRFLQMAGVLALAGMLCLGCANKSAKQNKEQTTKAPAAEKADTAEKPVAVKAEKPAGDIIAGRVDVRGRPLPVQVVSRPFYKRASEKPQQA